MKFDYSGHKYTPRLDLVCKSGSCISVMIKIQNMDTIWFLKIKYHSL